MGLCFSSTRMASFDLRSYFLRSSSPFVTCISSRGLPIQNSCTVSADIFEKVRGRGYEVGVVKKV